MNAARRWWSALSAASSAALSDLALGYLGLEASMGDRNVPRGHLEPARGDYSGLMASATAFQGGGEEPGHRALAEYVRHHPELVGVGKRQGPGAAQHSVPSGDRIDVLFRTEQEFVGVAVKSARSGMDGITRGIFQCIQYEAVLNAMAVAEQQGRVARAVLVLEGALPPQLQTLRIMLGVDVVELSQPRC